LRDTEATRALWPHAFEARLDVTLSAGQLRTALTLTNIDQRALDFCRRAAHLPARRRHRLPMLAKRIIPCLDVTGGRVVKGVNFTQLRDAGDPVEIAARYNEQGADELTFLDITATSDGRDLILPIIEAVASQVFIPLTVGGGVRTVEDVRRLLNSGADKTSFNSAAIANPQVIATRRQIRLAVHRGGD
jgi:uncharacterized protein related to proFAR isomerase